MTDALVIISERDARPGGSALLALAVSRGWVGLPLRGTALQPKIMALPETWRGEASAPRVVRYGAGEQIERVLAGLAGKGKWVAVCNGRFPFEIPREILARALVPQSRDGADVVAITVVAEQRAYGEKLRVTSDGTVLGFRRLYDHGIGVAAPAADWPHVLFVRRSALAGRSGTDRADRDGGSFETFVARCRERGLLVRAFAAGGRLWDLDDETDLVAYFERVVRTTRSNRGGRRAGNGAEIAPGARIEGTVIIEERARIENDAVVIGPAFVGKGAQIRRGAILRRAIVAPGVCVNPGEVIRNRVIMQTTPEGADRDAPIPRRADGDAPIDSPFRVWPLWSYARLGKRLLDIVATVLALAILAPLFALIAVAIKLNSRGPVFYRDRRQGRRGNEFDCIKFRTMVSEAAAMQDMLRRMNEVDGPQFKIMRDPRLTLVGSFLRATNLDEIPQFLNVLLGQMSVVGPRPSPDDENQLCPSWREARLSVRPGITGLWQVSRRWERDKGFQEWIYYDTKYVRELSLPLDLAIMLKTARILVSDFVRFFMRDDGAHETP